MGTQGNLALYAPTDDCLRDVAEFHEVQPESCLAQRNQLIASVKDLGPHDLVYLVKAKSKGKSESRQTTSYHFVSGLDSSSSASIAAHVTDLSRALVGHGGSWLLGRLSSPWRVISATVCCWDAFSKVDVRVEISIPGGVRSYVVDPVTMKAGSTTTAIWAETYVSGMLRALQGGYERGLRVLDPLPTPEDEARFLEAARALFWDGWRLGTGLSSPQLASCTNNRLAQGLLSYFLEAQRPECGAAWFRPLARQNPALDSLIAACLFHADREAEAVDLLHTVITTGPASAVAPALLVQFDLLLAREQYPLASAVISKAIQLAPMELEAWSRLAALQIHQANYEAALLTLNSFPFVNPEDNDPPPRHGAALWQPKEDLSLIDLSEIEPTNRKENPLEALKAPNLRGTPLVAYGHLARMLGLLGWDALLAWRQRVFVMEQEYILERSGSTTGIGGVRSGDVDAPMPAKARHQHKLSSDEQKGSLDGPSGQTAPPKKRLCERWLDSLFMVVFEDLRLHSLYRAELQAAKADGRPYQRTPREWLLIGDLCRRLGQPDEAREAYERCIDSGFSRAAWTALLDTWVGQRRLGHAMTACKNLAGDAVNRREPPYHPSPVSLAIHRLVRSEGASAVREAGDALGLPEPLKAYLAHHLDRYTASEYSARESL